jgi:hypothetical protein
LPGLVGSLDLIQYLAFQFFQLSWDRWIPFNLVDDGLGEGMIEIGLECQINEFTSTLCGGRSLYSVGEYSTVFRLHNEIFPFKGGLEILSLSRNSKGVDLAEGSFDGSYEIDILVFVVQFPSAVISGFCDGDFAGKY